MAICVSALQSGKDCLDISIKNFSKVDNCYYRGTQPNNSDFEKLSNLGIKTIINLRYPFFFSKTEMLKQKIFANNLGMNYINVPMLPYQPPTNEQIDYFLKIFNNPDNLPVYVFCKEGKDRTGLMTALYRVKYYHWNYDQAYTEMKSYGYHSILYPRLKYFLYDYARLSNTNNYY